MNPIKPGLENVVAAETRLSSVNGQIGELIIAGFPVEELAGRATFEEAIYLLWHDQLPNAEQLAQFRQEIASGRDIPPHSRSHPGYWQPCRAKWSWLCLHYSPLSATLDPV